MPSHGACSGLLHQAGRSLAGWGLDGLRQTWQWENAKPMQGGESDSRCSSEACVQRRAVGMGAKGMMLEPRGCWEDRLFSRTTHPQSITVFNSFPFLPNNAHSLKKI